MRALRFLVALALAPCFLGCGSEDADAASQPKPKIRDFDYPQDGSLRLNHLQTKGTHNSYHVEKEGNTIPEWRYTHAPLDVQLEEQGVRAFELDVQYDWDAEVFLVHHVSLVDEISTCPELGDCIRAIASWSLDRPAHHPILVQIEPKDRPPQATAEDYFAKLEATILGELPRESILTPDDVRGEAKTLREAILDRGWPTLGEARGKVLFFVDDSGPWRERYTRGNTSLDGRLLFVDSSPEDPFAAVRVLNDPIAQADEIADSVKAGLLVRTRADSDGSRAEGQREAALASGAHIISTDFPIAVTGKLEPFEIPGGSPSRCNPLVAPEGCTAEALENPAFMGE